MSCFPDNVTKHLNLLQVSDNVYYGLSNEYFAAEICRVFKNDCVVRVEHKYREIVQYTVLPISKTGQQKIRETAKLLGLSEVGPLVFRGFFKDANSDDASLRQVLPSGFINEVRICESIDAESLGCATVDHKIVRENYG